MIVDVVPLPSMLGAADVAGRNVVVIDVLRATTTIATALDVGVTQVRIFASTEDAARAARGAKGSHPLLAGEIQCKRPRGFDLGNSPREFRTGSFAGRTVFMSTTNGTRAVLAVQHAGAAASICVGALVNATAVGKLLASADMPVTVLCAGTDGQFAQEDILAAGAIIDAMAQLVFLSPASDMVTLARRLFQGSRGDLAGALRESTGGRNIIAARLEADIDVAAQLDSISIVGVLREMDLSIVPAN
jgi:2-phosphosulfolactate phosphatase